MRIAILDLCTPHAEFDRFGSIAELTEAWMAPALPEAALTSIHVAGGAPLPGVDAFDGFLLTGSEKGVYDETPWMAPLTAFLRAARDARRPVFGVCFGHQIMAEAYGGKAEKATTGYVVGVRAFETIRGTIHAHAMHQDQVTRTPPGARVTATAPYCPVAALDYDFPARSIQFHPEYGADFVNHAIDVFEGDVLSPEAAAGSRASMSAAAAPTDLWRAEVAAFFRETLGGAPATDAGTIDAAALGGGPAGG